MIVFLVRPVKYLSRESQKLTVMIRGELVSDSATYYKSLVIYSVLCEGLVLVQPCVKGTLVRIVVHAQGAST